MPNTNDLRAYAGSAVKQGKQTVSTAQAQFSGVTGQASELVTKFAGTVRDSARGNVSDLRASTEKFVNRDAVQAAVEPRVAHLRSYGHAANDRVDALVATLKNDPRFAKLFETADSVSGRLDALVATLKKDPRFAKLLETVDSASKLFVELLQDYVVKPVQQTLADRDDDQPAPTPKVSDEVS